MPSYTFINAYACIPTSIYNKLNGLPRAPFLYILFILCLVKFNVVASLVYR